jgi:FixJ family two-component response regulator
MQNKPAQACLGSSGRIEKNFQAGHRQILSVATTKPLIAVVDDDRSVVKSLARMLRLAGYAVETFCSAGEFLAALPASPPQCLVLDVHMPEMSGLELQDRLAAQESCLPVIFMTAYDTPQTRERIHRAGSFGLLLKPFGNEALLRAIREALGCQSQDPAAGAV